MKNQGETILMACIYLINSKLLVTMFGNAGCKAPLGHTICRMLDFGETHFPKEALP
jgi:hypothetical protein